MLSVKYGSRRIINATKSFSCRDVYGFVRIPDFSDPHIHKKEWLRFKLTLEKKIQNIVVVVSKDECVFTRLRDN